MDNKMKRVLAPSIYKKFECKGAACRYTCCKNWQVTMNKNEYRAWKKHGILPNGNNDRGKVRLCFDETRTIDVYAEIILTDEKECPYLTDDGLCQIQKQYGVKEMIGTCRIFPRVSHNYFDHVECSFSLGCEKVLELLLEEKEGIILNEESPRSFEGHSSKYNINDKRKHPKLKSYYDIQTLSFALLQSEEMTMENRLFLLGMALERIESFYTENNADEASAYTMNFLQLSQQPDYRNILDKFPNNGPLTALNNVISAVSILDFPNEFKSHFLLEIAQAVSHKRECGSENPELEYYQECKERFRNLTKGKEYFFENVMVMCLLWLNIPYKNLDKSLWENYLYFVWIWIMLKGILCLSMTEESTDEEMIDICVILFRKLGHNPKRFTEIIDGFRETGDSLAHVAILLRGC